MKFLLLVALSMGGTSFAADACNLTAADCVERTLKSYLVATRTANTTLLESITTPEFYKASGHSRHFAQLRLSGDTTVKESIASIRTRPCGDGCTQAQYDVRKTDGSIKKMSSAWFQLARQTNGSWLIAKHINE